MTIPIVSAADTIVGWTHELPKYEGLSIRHEEAERLISGAVQCLWFEIGNPVDATRAGAPPNWVGAWQCPAICSKRLPPEAIVGHAVIQNGP